LTTVSPEHRAWLAEEVERMAILLRQFPTHTDDTCSAADRCGACLGRQWIQTARAELARAD